MFEKFSSINELRTSPGEEVAFLNPSVGMDVIQTKLFSGNNIVIEENQNSYTPLYEKYKKKNGKHLFFLCLTNNRFFTMDVASLIENYIVRRFTEFDGQNITMSLLERIKIAFHEAFSNAFMWSNLELHSVKEFRSLEFYDALEKRLSDPIYGNRMMSIHAIQNNGFLDLGILVQGKPIIWPLHVDKVGVRGTTLIQSLTDAVIFDDDSMGITLRFKIGK